MSFRSEIFKGGLSIFLFVLVFMTLGYSSTAHAQDCTGDIHAPNVTGSNASVTPDSTQLDSSTCLSSFTTAELITILNIEIGRAHV